MSNPWLALDGSVSPVAGAREARRLWDAFLDTQGLEGLRAPIAESWLRSEAAGIDPVVSRAPTAFVSRRDVADLWRDHPLEVETPLIRRWLRRVAADTAQLIVVSDVDGVLLYIDGDVRLRSAAADGINFTEGTLWTENAAGTNAIGSALAAEHAIQVHAAEHFSEAIHSWTCAAAPIHDPEDESVIGIVDLTGLLQTADPIAAAAVVATARAVEADLRVRMQLRDARLRLRHLEHATASRRPVALVAPSGRVISDDPGGLVRADRIDAPEDGGELTLPDGSLGVAEKIPGEDAFLVHGVDKVGSPPRRRPAELDLKEWRRAQTELSELAEQQASLRRVATLVAGRATPDEIFGTVAEEVARLIGAERAAVVRYEADGTAAVFAHTSGAGLPGPPAQVYVGDGSVAELVRQSGRTCRRDDYEDVSREYAASLAHLAERPSSCVGTPILVGGRVWGAIIAATLRSERLAPTTEVRMQAFAELVETAISNAVVQSDLAASRARLVAAADESRRRVERDLHDGAQQRLVSLVLQLRLAQEREPSERDELGIELERAVAEATAALDELRRVSHGLNPVVLSRHGLGAGLRALARRSPCPVELDVALERRLPAEIETTAYYVTSEALTNASKHARATCVRVALAEANGSVLLSIRDDGLGGADPAQGSGLAGLRDRVEAVGGSMVIESPPGGGTSLLVGLPVAGAPIAVAGPENTNPA